MHVGWDTPSIAADEFAELRKARSLLLLLIATCQQTLLALEATANVLDTNMTEDLRAMIARSEKELTALTKKLADEPA